MEQIDLNQLRRDLIQVRDWAQRIIDRLQPPPAIEAQAIPPAPAPAPTPATEGAAEAPPAAPAPASEVKQEVDKKLPMFVWKRTPKGFTVEFWPNGEAVIGETKRSYVKAYNVKNIHYGLTLGELSVLYPLPAEFASNIIE